MGKAKGRASKTMEYAWGNHGEELAKPWKTIEHAWGKHREEPAKPWKTIEHAWGNMGKSQHGEMGSMCSGGLYYKCNMRNVQLFTIFKQEECFDLSMQNEFIIQRVFLGGL